MGLEGRAQNRRDRRETDKKIEHERLGQAVQRPGSVDLGSKHCVHACRVELPHGSGDQDTRRMDHSFEREPAGCDLVENAANSSFVGTISLSHHYVRALVLEEVQGLTGLLSSPST